MRKIALFTVASAAAGLFLSAACGKTETNTITNTVYVTVTGGNGGAGGGTAGTGGTTGTKIVGESCKLGSDCASGQCLSEEASGWGTGYCTEVCNSIVSCSSDADECISGIPGTFGGFCLTKCNPANTGECAGGQLCYDLGDGVTGICIGGCATAADCPVMGSCDPAGGVQDANGNTSGSCLCTDNTGCPTLGNCEPGGYCAVPEICNNQKDDDSDGLVDCEDADDCATDDTCAAAISAACSGAVDVSAGGSFDGNTVGGTNTFAQTCSSLFGSYIAGAGMNERVYKYTATGAVSLGMKVVSSDTLDWYVRTDCADDTTNLGCLSPMLASDPPVTWAMNAGETVYIFVDGQGGDAAFTLEITTVDLAAVCATATVINAVGDTNGNNTSGTAVFNGSCGGGGNESIYRYTPNQTGNLQITLTPGDPAMDMVLYARSDCADSNSQLPNGCADVGFAGDPETITVAVTNAVPIFIFADNYGNPGPFTLNLAYQ